MRSLPLSLCESTRFREGHMQRRADEGRVTRLLRDEIGSQLVETAIVAPLLVLMALGAADFARVNYAAITLSHAARAGAQFGAHSPAAASDTAGMVQAARDEAADLEGPINVTAERFCRCPSGSAVSCNAGTCGTGVFKEIYVSVTAARTFNTLAPYPGVPSAVPLSRQAVLRVR